jgi:hypothetical protein
VAKVTSITVRAARTLPHPYESFANFNASIELHADLDEGDDVRLTTATLQGQAESMIEQHCAELRHSIGEFKRVADAREQVPKLERQIAMLQQQLDVSKVDADLGPLFGAR